MISLCPYAIPATIGRLYNWVKQILAFWPDGVQIYAYTEKESENILWRQIDSVMGGIKLPKNHNEVDERGVHGGPSQPMD